ncbi:transposase [Methanoculleus chikugoensis]|uniref:transposase n=1 Tax=Methanoculleus chikugoensis TaxID=118126 RepID=UPI000A6C51D4|nr:transposase [Methanoculleus chikugoensis]
MINGILYVLTTGCSWLDVPTNYGTKSTVHRYHLELCERGVYQAIFLDLLRTGYEIKKSISPIVRQIPRISRQKKGIDRL